MGYCTTFVVILCLCSVIARPNQRSSNEDDSHGGFFKAKKTTCGYESCHPTKDGVLNVHIVPHTHDDVGWLKTVDQYYYGSRTSIQRAGVQYILDSVVDELIKDPERRFVYVETAFFDKWWAEQNDQRRHHVKRLVQEGRLEFAGGAWTMNDEAAAHYQSVLDQLTWGLRMLNDTFGTCGRPRAGWQIDPFGHSRELANMWALSGFDGLLLGRVDFQDRKRRSKDKELEMMWRGSDDLGKASDILTGIMYNTYSPPPGFCFDIVCSDEPIIDDITSPDYNVDKRVKEFVDYINLMSKSYKTNNVIVTMGGDFTYQDAHVWYKNMDKLIKFVNKKEPSMRLIYSTPSCYIKSLYDSNATWPIKEDDFFPYSSDEHAFWTGYFTSRPTMKYYERKGNNMLQVCKQLYSMTNLEERDKIDLNMMRSAMGILQHHDAITGTEKQHVARDYARILEAGIQDCFIVITDALNKLMTPKSVAKSKNDDTKDDALYLPMSLCPLNITECDVTENFKKFVVTIYNPFGQSVDQYVRLPITGKKYSVKDSAGNQITTEILPLSNSYIDQIKTRNSTATSELIFIAQNLPQVGYSSYYVEETEGDDKKPNDPSTSDQNEIGNEFIKVKLDGTTGLVGEITIINGGKNTVYPLKQELLYYEGMVGNNSNSKNRASGAYIFRPKAQNPVSITEKPENVVVKGNMVEEIHQRFSNWTSQVIRIYKGQKHVEFEWLVGPIPIEDKIGKEVITRFSTDFKTKGVFYTDSNGRQMLRRELNKRPTWDLNLEEPTSGNYYPVTTMMSIKDEASKKQLFIMTDRAQGGSSLKDGQLELMVHRRLLHDDAFGVEEALNETVDGVGLVAKGTHYLVIGDSESSLVAFSKEFALKKLLEPMIIISPADNLTFDQWKNNKNEYNGIKSLPKNIYILTMEPWKGRSILLRLEHYLEKSDDPVLSKEVTVDLDQLFTGIKIESVRETTLAANQWIEESSRFKWSTSNRMPLEQGREGNEIRKKNRKENLTIKGKYEVTLSPMEIKTFIIHGDFMN